MRFETAGVLPEEREPRWPRSSGRPGGASPTSLAIAERCNLELEFGRLNFPPLDHVMRPGRPPTSASRGSRRERLARRYPNAPDYVSQRLEYELK